MYTRQKRNDTHIQLKEKNMKINRPYQSYTEDKFFFQEAFLYIYLLY